MKITVLYGGPSAERSVSLVSGQAVIDGLRQMGHDVFPSDVSPTDLSGLDHPADVIFPVLHGQFGESGELQEILESRGLPFVGSSSRASRLGMDKVKTKQAWESAGLPTPSWRVIESFDPASAPAGPCVVKAPASGSSIDVFVFKSANPNAVRLAIEGILSRHGRALVEQFISGPELTVGLLEEEPLAPIRIVSKTEFFDFASKYQRADTEHRFDTGLPDSLVQRCRDLARQGNQIVGARDLARIDIMIAPNHQPYLLEINTLPGFTPTSLLPEAAKNAGIPFGPLVDRLVRRAHARHHSAAAA